MGGIGVSWCWSRMWVWVCGYRGLGMSVSGCWYGCVRMRLWVCQGVGVTECGCRRVEQSCGRLHRPARRPRLLLRQVGWMLCGCVRRWVYHCGYIRVWTCQGVGISLWLYQGVDVSGCGCITVAISGCGRVRRRVYHCGYIRVWTCQEVGVSLWLCQGVDVSGGGCITVAISGCGRVRRWVYHCGYIRVWTCQGVGVSLWLYQGVDVSGCGYNRVWVCQGVCVSLWLYQGEGVSACGCITVAISGCENGFECFKVLRLHQSVWVLWLSPLSLRLCRMVDTLSSSSLSSLIHGVSHPFL